jgi:hypothetical protein
MKRAAAAWAALAVGVALAGCGGHPADRATAGAHPAVTPGPSRTASALYVTASGTGLRLVAGTPVRFGADSAPGVAGELVLTCRGQGLVHVRPTEGKATDVQCGGTSEVRTGSGGTMFTASTTSGAAMTLDWTLKKMGR